MQNIQIFKNAIDKNTLNEFFEKRPCSESITDGIILYHSFNSSKKYYSAGEYSEIINVNFLRDSTRGSVAEFNGKDSYIDFGELPVDNVVTISGWVKQKEFNRDYGAIAALGHAYAFRITTGGALLFTIPQMADVLDNDARITLNKWQHVAVTSKEQHGVTFYLNGVKTDFFEVEQYQSVLKELKVGSNLWNDFFKGQMDDLIVRKMGQFRINAKTTKKDMEWVMGLGAGYDAGVDFYISPNFEEINKDASSILSEIKKWEEARMNGLFTEEQKVKLRDPYTFYGLDLKDGVAHLVFIESWAPEGGRAAGEDEFSTLPAKILESTPEAPVSLDYKHSNMTTEPGLPTCSTWEYFCAGPKQKLKYVIRLTKASKEATTGIYLKVGTQKAVMPFALKSGDYIVNTGSKISKHYSENHELKKEVTLDASCLMVNEGQNQIEFDYKGKGRVAGPELIVNFCTKK